MRYLAISAISGSSMDEPIMTNALAANADVRRVVAGLVAIRVGEREGRLGERLNRGVIVEQEETIPLEIGLVPGHTPELEGREQSVETGFASRESANAMTKVALRMYAIDGRTMKTLGL